MRIPPILDVGLDRALARRRPGCVWALREALVALGYGWREVPPEAPADLAYVLAGHGDRLQAAVVIESPPSAATLPTVAAGPMPRAVGGRLVFYRDLLHDLFTLASGALEADWPRNRHGHLDVPLSQRRALRDAPGSRLVAALGVALRETGRPPGLPRWPRGARAAAALSHDVDYPEVVRLVEPLRLVAREGWRGVRAVPGLLAGTRHHWHFGTWMAFERSLGLRSVFFFSARRGSLLRYAAGTPDPFYDIGAPRVSRVIGALVDDGWEVGMHASYRAWCTPGALEAEKARLERVAAAPVAGVRHHYWHLDPLVPERTLALHDQAGFVYDASLAHDRHMGFRRGLAWPFRPWMPSTLRGVETLQLPTCWMDEQSFGHWDGRPGEADAAVQETVRTVSEVGGCLLLNVHEYKVDHLLHPGRFAAARSLWAAVAGDSDLWRATPREIALHWHTRQRVCEAVSVGLAPP